MPNIEIHSVRPEETQNLRLRIINALSGASYRKGIVITDARDFTVDLNGTRQPFLRILATKADGTEIFAKIERRLAGLNIDIEEMFIHRFIPKKK